ncbi:hypothetical protein NA56DRAFT_684547 [Hyaloscypha hepaticicola]|uniref:Heterokaryon incompatibility domain-containing protein n=1 Tax=Hyaloscypha hepaticicola TaxID=2082293 RepID=A0A2J6QLI0_9HELO|nr:hypothetical protein NA56DRAFT_684547 [Hyaloscypha hepaticicola]
MTNSPHKPLELYSRQIRLLRLLSLRECTGPQRPWHSSEEIRCELFIVNLDDCPDYEALSYTWGSSGTDIHIELDGQDFSIRPNLAYALAALRRSESRVLWVDAFCINQNNIHERNHQVEQMGEIYRQARQVLAWLGRPSPRWGSTALDAVKLANNLGSFFPISNIPPTPPTASFLNESAWSSWVKDLVDHFKKSKRSKNTQSKREGEPKRTQSEKALVGLIRDWHYLRQSQVFRHELELREREQLQILGDQRLSMTRDRMKLWLLQEIRTIAEGRLKEKLLGVSQVLSEAQKMIEVRLQEQEREEGVHREKSNALQNLLELQRLLLSPMDKRFNEKTLEAWLEKEVPQGLKEGQYTALLNLVEQRQAIRQQEKELQQLEDKRRSVERRYNNWQKEMNAIDQELRQLHFEKQNEPEERKIVLVSLTEKWRELRSEEFLRWKKSLFDNIQDLSSNFAFLCLANVFNLPYWRRLWIIQEVLLADNIVLCFGDDTRTTTDWGILTRARHSLEQIPTAWEEELIMGVPVKLFKESLPFQLDKQRAYRDRGWSLEKLLITTEKSLCQDPRDKIYGLLGLLTDFRKGDIGIDYSKQLHEIYQDVIRWYYGTRARRQDSCRLEKLSQLLQLSFKCHLDLQAIVNEPNPGLLGEVPPCLPVETFCTTAILKGPIFPVENNFEDRELMDLHQGDWVHTLVGYLYNPTRYESRDALEKELIYLDSVSTSFTIPHSSNFAYATASEDALHLINRATEQSNYHALRKSAGTAQFFGTEDGEFGIASSCMRDDDVLCQFHGSNLGAILRRRGNHYILVSRAILSPGPAKAAAELAPKPIFFMVPALAHQPRSNLKENLEGKPTLNMVLDATALQVLTCPFELSMKHRYREPRCIQESSFGWYEFIKFGMMYSVDVEAILVPNSTRGMVHKLRIPNLLPASKWSSIWSMLTQPFRRVWLLFQILSYLKNVVHKNLKTVDAVALESMRVLWLFLRDLKTVQKRGVRSTQRSRVMAFRA